VGGTDQAQQELCYKPLIKRSGAFSYISDEIAEYNLYRQLSEFSKKTLIIYGDNEPGAEISGKKLYRVIPGSKFIIMHKCGHFPFVEKPDEYFNTLSNFLKE
jgi:pimeloyl-ACP methyl ester carboxylesterase